MGFARCSTHPTRCAVDPAIHLLGVMPPSKLTWLSPLSCLKPIWVRSRHGILLGHGVHRRFRRNRQLFKVRRRPRSRTRRPARTASRQDAVLLVGFHDLVLPKRHVFVLQTYARRSIAGGLFHFGAGSVRRSFFWLRAFRQYCHKTMLVTDANAH